MSYRIIKRLICPGLYLILLLPATAQPVVPDRGYVFNDSIVPRIDILITDEYLNKIFSDPASDNEYPATFIFSTPGHSDTVRNVGFRIRGNTSRYSAKKSWKVSFNTFVTGQKFYGLEKMNINGEHNDPSIMRAKLCWDMLKFLNVPASRANHARLYINGNYYGVYLNVEHVDEEFMRSRFGDPFGNLYKCLWPADLAYLGDRQDSYKFGQEGRRAYDLVTNRAYDDYQDLVEFIETLNISGQSVFTCDLDKVFNIPGFLKVTAADILTGNWDDYIYLKNNYYLYMNPVAGKFEFIPYDLDNTFGVDWFGIDWASRDIYRWSADESRPLYEKLMAVPEFKNLFSHYMEMLLDHYFNQENLFERIDYLHDLIRPYVEQDPYYPLDYGFSIQDFDNAPEQAVGAHVKWGLKPFILQRGSTARDQLDLNGLVPVASYLHWNRPDIGDTLIIRALIEDDDLDKVQLMLAVNGWNFEAMPLTDDGSHWDNKRGDGVYGIGISPAGSPWEGRFYLKMTDHSGNVRDYPCEPVSISIPWTSSTLVINEFMASNHSILQDEYGEFDDWIEIWNAGKEPAWLGNKFLSDDLSDRNEWKLPDDYLAPSAFMIIWVDGQPSQGDRHTNFRLERSGEEIGLYDAPSTGFRLIDRVVYGPQADDVSLARVTDGCAEWLIAGVPTPGQSNHLPSWIAEAEADDMIIVYPNPVLGETVFFSREAGFSLLDATGRVLATGKHQNILPVGSLTPGLYLLVFENGQVEKLLVE